MKKSLIVPAIILIIGGGGSFAATRIEAQTTIAPETTLVQRLVQKFNLDESEVQAVFDEEMADHHAQMQTRMEQRIDKLVTDGKITQEQKQKILDKLEEMHDQMPVDENEFENMTPEQRQSEMQKRKTELEAWAKENGIEVSYLRPNERGGRGGRGMMGRHFMGKDSIQQ